MNTIALALMILMHPNAEDAKMVFEAYSQPAEKKAWIELQQCERVKTKPIVWSWTVSVLVSKLCSVYFPDLDGKYITIWDAWSKGVDDNDDPVVFNPTPVSAVLFGMHQMRNDWTLDWQ